MATRSFSRALRTPKSRQLITPAAQRRTIISASNIARASLIASSRFPVTSSKQQTRGLKHIDFAGTKETVYGWGCTASCKRQWANRDHRARGLAARETSRKFYTYEHLRRVVCEDTTKVLPRNTSRMTHLHSSDMVRKGMVKVSTSETTACM